MKHRPAPTGKDEHRYSGKPDFLAAADLDADGRTDLIIGWGWASYRCDGSFLSVLMNDGHDAAPVYRPAEVELPGDCGARGWLASVKEVRQRRIFIELKQRYPGVRNVQQISATVGHDGRFTFFDPAGRPARLDVIVKSIPMRIE